MIKQKSHTAAVNDAYNIELEKGKVADVSWKCEVQKLDNTEKRVEPQPQQTTVVFIFS